MEQLRILADATDLSNDDIRRDLKRRGLPESGDDIQKLHVCLALARAGLSTVKIMGAYILTDIHIYFHTHANSHLKLLATLIYSIVTFDLTQTFFIFYRGDVKS